MVLIKIVLLNINKLVDFIKLCFRPMYLSIWVHIIMHIRGIIRLGLMVVIGYGMGPIHGGLIWLRIRMREC